MNSILLALLVPIFAGATGIVQQAGHPANSSVQTPAATAAAAAPKKDEDCGCEADIPKDTFAVVDGVKITTKEIEDEIKDQVSQLQSQVPEARQKELQFEIDGKILELEAAKRGVPVSKLVDTEVTSKVVKPTEAEAQDFYNKNKDRVQGDFKDLKQDLILY
ncbi:MAG TPA: hypothetical protein VI756_29070, partial [Blastocatellia bacterium]